MDGLSLADERGSARVRFVAQYMVFIDSAATGHTNRGGAAKAQQKDRQKTR